MNVIEGACRILVITSTLFNTCQQVISEALALRAGGGVSAGRDREKLTDWERLTSLATIEYRVAPGSECTRYLC